MQNGHRCARNKSIECILNPSIQWRRGDTDPVPLYVVITGEIKSKVGDLPSQTRHHITHRHTYAHMNAHKCKHTHILNY